MSGGYSQQSYQPPSQPPMWAPPQQMQQQQQPPPTNYYAQQSYPQYGGYPPQQTGYDYCSTPQQQLPVSASAAPTDNSAYNYNAYGDTTAYSQQTYAYPPQDGSTNTTATPMPAQQAPPPPATQQGYNGQQAGYYDQPPSQAGYGYGYGPGPGYNTGYAQIPAAYNSTDTSAPLASSDAPKTTSES